MALSINTLGDYAMRTSIKGRRFGLWRSAAQYEALAGPVGLLKPIEDISTTVATSATPYGVTNVICSGSTQGSVNTLQAPIPGLKKTLVLASSSTGNHMFRFTDATLITASGATGSTVVNLKGMGAAIEMFALSTSQWIQTNYSSSLGALVLFSTTT